jgi:hypothetical protein
MATASPLLLIDVAGRPMNVLTPGFQSDLAECVERRSRAMPPSAAP